jgi:outer membrane protein insertion porin family
MAEVRNDSGLAGRVWLLIFPVVIVLGAPLVLAQVPPEVPPGAPLIAPPPQEMVVDVQVKGNRTVPVDKILPHIRTRKGRPFDANLIEEDVRRLNRSRLFVTVRPAYLQVQGGRVVIFEVVERPVLQDIKYVGSESITKKVLAKETGLKVGDAIDPYAIQEARKKIEDLYQRRGFGKIRVTVLEGDRVGDTRAIFLINEGLRQKVFWVYFKGNTIASSARLRTQIKSNPPLLYLFKGEMDRKEIEEDLKRLTAYYRGLGFMRAKIGRELEFNERQNWLTLTFIIDEGPRYSVRNVAFIGPTKIPTEKLAADLKLTSGEYFNQAKMEADLRNLSDKYGSIGYVFAKVEDDRRMLEDEAKLDLVYTIKEGDRYRVGRIDVAIKGENPHTRLSAVLNRVSLRPGEIVDIRKLRDSERRLKASQLFMNSPMEGEVPKIVFHPPELDEGETVIADRPRHRVNYRGQSPDPAPPGNGDAPGTPAASPGWSRSGSREVVVDCVVTGTLNPRAPAEPQTPLPFPTRLLPAGPQQAPPGEPPCQPQPYPVYQGRPYSAARPAPLVVRGQYTTEAGPLPSPNRASQAWPANERAPAASAYPPSAQGNPADALPPPPGSPLPGAAAPTQMLPGQEIFGGGPAGPLNPDDRVFTRPLPLEIWTKEAQTGRLMLGVGINSDAGLYGSIMLDEMNFDWTRFPTGWEDIRNATAFRGAGQRFRIEAVPGIQVQRYMVNFMEPYLLNTETSLGLSGFYYDRIFTEWQEQRLGGRVALGYHFTPHLSGSVSFRGEKINIRNPIVPAGVVPALDEVLGDNTLYGVGAQLAHDKRDSPFLATEGHLIEANFEQVIGTFQYPHVELDLRKYFLLHQRPDGSGRQVLSLNGRVGITGDNTPIYDHYYAGGFSTIRGFQFRGASPQEAGILVGGHFNLLGSAEYMFPITADDMLRAVVFCDTGTVEPTIRDWPDKYRVSPGFGLRIVIPAMGPAPIAFDFAFPISFEPSDRREVFAFFLGVLR